MKVLIDSNVFVSAILYPDSISSNAFHEATMNHKVIICDYQINELILVFKKKFPDKLSVLKVYLSVFESFIDFVKVPKTKSKYNIRDSKDEPILRTALYYGVDVILTGDKDFLSLKIDGLKILSPSEFVTKRSR